MVPVASLLDTQLAMAQAVFISDGTGRRGSGHNDSVKPAEVYTS